MSAAAVSTLICWRVEAAWPLDRYGLHAPFEPPPTWVFLDSGASMGERDMAWQTPPVSAHDVRAAVQALATPGVEFYVEACAPAWVYELEPFERFLRAHDAWDEYGRRLMLGEACEPPQQEDFPS